MPNNFIPNSAPWMTEREIQAITNCLQQTNLGSNPDDLKDAVDQLKKMTGAEHALLTTSCTKALELALLCLDLEPGDEVLLPSYTFVSCALAVMQAGGTPKFVEIEDRTLNMDLDALEKVITPKAKAIIIVHYAGVSCDMDRLMNIAKKHNLVVVEDAAHALDATYKGKHLGTIGDFGAFSFHYTKNFVSGEGGALLVNNKKYRDVAEIMHEKGTNRSAFLRGEIDKYSWVSRGSSYVMSSVLSALLQTQLERCSELQNVRKRATELYEKGLKRLVDEGHIRLPDQPDHNAPSYHLAYFLLEDASQRQALLTHLKDKGVGAVFHYVPLHSSSFAEEHLGTKEGDMPVTEAMAASIVRLPLHPKLTDEDVQYVIDCTVNFFHPEEPIAERIEKNEGGDKKQKVVDFSLIIPCYNEAPHLHESLDAVVETLNGTNMSYEIILIDDCSTDETVDRIREYLAKHPSWPLRAIFHEQNKGRGDTVTEGVHKATGRFAGFIDIDLETPARYIPDALAVLQRGEADMVLADRAYKFAFSALQRTIMSMGYRTLTQWLLGTPPYDTEAGFKFFRRDTMLPVLEKIHDNHWFWDTEITVRSHDAGLRIHNLPVLFIRKTDKISTVKAFGDSWRSFWKLFRFKKERKGIRDSGFGSNPKSKSRMPNPEPK